MHILLVEDNAINQKVVRLILTKLGCSFVITSNGREALDYLSASPATHPRPNIILMNTSMPVLSGLDATRILRTQAPFINDPTIYTTPIIALSANSLQLGNQRNMFLAKGFDDTIQKPIRRAHLQKMIAYWSGRRVRSREGVLPVPEIGNRVPIPGRLQWGRVPWGVRGPRSFL